MSNRKPPQTAKACVVVILGLATIAALVPACPTHAQDVVPLEECRWVHGETSSDPGDAQYYEFEWKGAEAADTLVHGVIMNRATGTLDPFLQLFDANGRAIAWDDDSNGDLDAKIEFVSTDDNGDVIRALPPGRYFIKASGVAGNGKYILQAACYSAGTAGDGSCNGATELGEVPPIKEPNTYYPDWIGWEGTEDQIVEITVRRTSGTLIPQITVYHIPPHDENQLTEPDSVRQAFKSGTGRSIVLRIKLGNDGSHYADITGARGTDGEFEASCRTL